MTDVLELYHFERGFGEDDYWFKGSIEGKFVHLFIRVGWGLAAPMETIVYSGIPDEKKGLEILQRWVGERVEAREALHRMGYEWFRSSPNVLLPSEPNFRASWPARDQDSPQRTVALGGITTFYKLVNGKYIPHHTVRGVGDEAND